MQTRIKAVRRRVFETPAPVRVVGMLAGELTEEGSLLDHELGGVLVKAVKQARFKGDLTQTLLIGTEEGFALVVGLGKKRGQGLGAVRCAAAAVARELADTGFREAVVESFLVERLDKHQVTAAMTEGLLLGSYEFRTYKQDSPGRRIRYTLARAAGPAVERTLPVMEGVYLARDLVNEPPNVLSPEALAERVMALAKAEGLEARIRDRAELEELGMGAYLGVAQGSVNKPKFIELIYRPNSKPKRVVALVGKGLTFDTGGYSLKPPTNMTTMKGDMAGAAAVLGTMMAVARLALPVEVRAYVAAAENMISGTAYRVDDVLTAMNGKRIEVNNTDAEGRLTLADALTYASRQGPDVLIELSTLTGACVVALGEQVAGIFAFDDSLGKAVLKAADAAGEAAWRMPVVEEYRELLKSDVADLKNTGGRFGGAITAALFLSEFTEAPFVHIDIAGPAFADKEHMLGPSGGTGYGVRTLVRYLEDLTHD